MTEHWWCPRCGTFDGPISNEACDVCSDDSSAVERLVPRAVTEEMVDRVVDSDILDDIVRSTEEGSLGARDVWDDARAILYLGFGITLPSDPALTEGVLRYAHS
jgi:hypothetical protein